METNTLIYKLLKKVDVEKQIGLVKIKVYYNYKTIKSKGEIEYNIFGNGHIIARHSFQPRTDDLPNLPRFGISMELPKILKILFGMVEGLMKIIGIGNPVPW